MTRTEYADVVAHKLSVVLIGCQHIGVYTDGTGLFSQRTDDVISLETIDLQDGNAVGIEQVFNDGNSLTDVFGRLLTLCLILWKSLATERGSVGVESHTDVRRLLLGEHLVQGVEESHNGAGVESLGVDARVLDEGVIRPVDERVGV